jgi:16S rRNA (uracil1498-N3)-methyltransferase
MTIPRFLVAPDVLDAAHAVLRGEELHHMRVRRLRPGSAVVLGDSLGRARAGVVVRVDRQQAIIAFRDAPVAARDSPLQLTLAQALIRPDKLDLVIEKATEIGATEIVLFTCTRSLRRFSETRIERWERIARSAVKQCQRSHAPLITGPVVFTDLLGHTPGSLRLFFWEGEHPENRRLTDLAKHAGTSVLAVVGPEGGFTAAETATARDAGFRCVSLGPRLLRAETAAIVALALCQFVWGDLGARALAAAPPAP